jgi:tetratricopeptide (TPR) repeat protein
VRANTGTRSENGQGTTAEIRLALTSRFHRKMILLATNDALPELFPPRGYVGPGELRLARDRSGADSGTARHGDGGGEPNPARTLVSRAVAEALAGRHPAALALLADAEAALEDGDTSARLLIDLDRAQVLLETGDLAGADEAAAAALRLARREREDRWAALAGLSAALVHLARGRRNEARSRLGEAVRRFARDGDALRQLQCHYLLGEIAYLAEDPIRAGSHYRDALGIARTAREQAWIELLTLRFEHR